MKIIPKEPDAMEFWDSVKEVYAEGGSIVNTTGLLAMADEADRKRANRRLDTKVLRENVDPEGLHLCYPMIMIEDGGAMRIKILIKQKDTMEPATGFLDVLTERWNDAREGTKSAIEADAPKEVNE